MAVSLDRTKILDASLAVIARHGFRKASLTDIARPLGVAKTALYHHFPGGKQELMHAVIKREVDLVLYKMRETMNNDTKPTSKMRSLILAKLDHFHRLRELFDVFIDVGEEVATLYHEHITSYQSAEREMIQTILDEGQKLKFFRQANMGRLAQTIQLVLHHLELPLVFSSREEMEKEVDELLAVLYYGIATTESQIPQVIIT